MTVPLLFTIEEMVDHFLDTGEPTATDLDQALSRVGRDHGPSLLVALVDEGLLTVEAAAKAVPSAWCGVEFPNRALDNTDWRHLFHLAGYTVDGVPSERPASPLRLFRGAVPDHRGGWSWTEDRELAEWFADRPHNCGQGQVWTAVVEPWRLLARITEERPGESEYVVDTQGLVILPLQQR